MPDTEVESTQSNHIHISKVIDWGFDAEHNFQPTMYGCVLCDATSPTPFRSDEDVFTDHMDCGPDCFGCKVKTLQMNAGDAKGSIISGGMTQKAWDKELDAYKTARAQGIQPASTKMKDIKKAVDISNKVGKAYDAGSPTGGIL
jgi:hypothetical protein